MKKAQHGVKLQGIYRMTRDAVTETSVCFFSEEKKLTIIKLNMLVLKHSIIHLKLCVLNDAVEKYMHKSRT